jgi:hypothetical protein
VRVVCEPEPFGLSMHCNCNCNLLKSNKIYRVLPRSHPQERRKGDETSTRNLAAVLPSDVTPACPVADAYAGTTPALCTPQPQASYRSSSHRHHSTLYVLTNESICQFAAAAGSRTS